MHPTTSNRRRMLAGLAMLAGLIGSAASAQQPAGGAPQPPPPPPVKIDKNTGSLIVPLNGAVQFKPSEKNIADVFVRNEDVLKVRFGPPDPKVLVLTGLQVGAPQMTITFEDRLTARYDVIVQPDFTLLKSVIRQAVPTANVDVIPGVGNVVILSGYVTKPEDLDAVQRIASSAVGGNVNNVVSTVQVGGTQHVLIDVTVAQVDRTELRERGFVFGIAGQTVGFSSVLGGLGVSNIGAGGAGGVGVVAGANTNLITSIIPASAIGALRALRTEGVAKFLSEPKVITQSGRPAILRSGGQQAILGPSSGINGPGVILQDVGTTLDVLPIVFGNGKIYLEVQPQFRSVNNGRGVTTAFGFTPGFNEQSTRSSVMLESGQTFAIGGLLETQTQASAEKVPYLGDLPLVGAAFSNVRHEERETELLILVTPRLVDALDCNQVPRRILGKETRSPDDYELFLESLVEAPRGSRQPWTGLRYKAAYKCHPSSAAFPCLTGNCVGGTAGAYATGTCVGGSCATPATHLGAGQPAAAPVVLPTSGGSEQAPEVPAALPPVTPEK